MKKNYPPTALCQFLSVVRLSSAKSLLPSSYSHLCCKPHFPQPANIVFPSILYFPVEFSQCEKITVFVSCSWSCRKFYKCYQSSIPEQGQKATVMRLITNWSTVRYPAISTLLICIQWTNPFQISNHAEGGGTNLIKYLYFWTRQWIESIRACRSRSWFKSGCTNLSFSTSYLMLFTSYGKYLKIQTQDEIQGIS